MRLTNIFKPKIILPTTENELVSKVLTPFLKWSHYEVFHSQKKTALSKFAGGCGFFVGGTSAYVMYPLGTGFAKIVLDFAEINDENIRNVVNIFFGTTAVCPMIALGAIVAKDRFQDLVTIKRLESQQIVKLRNEKLKASFAAVAYLLGAFSAIPQSSLTYKALQDESFMLKLITIPAFIGPFLFNSNAELQLINRSFDSIDKDEHAIINILREELRQKLKKVMKIIYELSDEKLDSIFHQVFSNEQPQEWQSSHETQSLNKNKIIFSLADNDTILDKPPAVNKPMPQWGKKAARAVGFTIGASSAYVYYGLGQAGLILFCNSIGITDPEILVPLGKLTGALAYIPNAALGAIATQDRFEQIYDAFFDNKKMNIQPSSWRKLRRFIAGFSISQGMLSATPLTYIAIEAAMGGSWYQKLLVIPTFVGPAAVRSKALEQLLNRGVDWLDNTFCNTVDTKRDNLIKAVLKIDKALAKLPDEQIFALYQEIIKSDKKEMLRLLPTLPQTSNHVTDNPFCKKNSF